MAVDFWVVDDFGVTVTQAPQQTLGGFCGAPENMGEMSAVATQIVFAPHEWTVIAKMVKFFSVKP